MDRVASRQLKSLTVKSFSLIFLNSLSFILQTLWSTKLYPTIKLLEKLGEGGMGVVYKAEDTKLERTVALKFLSLTSIGDEEKERFKREAKAAVSLNHSNIATIHAIDEADDQPSSLWNTSKANLCKKS